MPLNLPPKSTLNHKTKLTITLAYDQKPPKHHQHKKPLKRPLIQINDKHSSITAAHINIKR
ncbi:hypothetical protein AL524_24580 [Citrobacter amalonaticus]|nr:hypothetical protein AL524_24580 [Citrobacter amalonaticus]